MRLEKRFGLFFLIVFSATGNADVVKSTHALSSSSPSNRSVNDSPSMRPDPRAVPLSDSETANTQQLLGMLGTSKYRLKVDTFGPTRKRNVDGKTFGVGKTPDEVVTTLETLKRWQPGRFITNDVRNLDAKYGKGSGGYVGRRTFETFLGGEEVTTNQEGNVTRSKRPAEPITIKQGNLSRPITMVVKNFLNPQEQNKLTKYEVLSLNKIEKLPALNDGEGKPLKNVQRYIIYQATPPGASDKTKHPYLRITTTIQKDGSASDDIAIIDPEGAVPGDRSESKSPLASLKARKLSTK